MIGVLAIPHFVVGVEEALHPPCARRVVHVVGIGVGAESVARVERRRRFDGQVEMVALDELAKVGGAHVLGLLAQSVVQIEFVDAQLVRHGHVCRIRHTLGDPMMAADGFHPPDLVHVGEGNAVHLIGAVFLKQRAQALHAFTGRLDIRQDDGQEILLADAAGDLGLITVLAFLAFGRNKLDKGIGAKHTLVGGQCLGGAHGHVGLVHAGLSPHAFLQIGVGNTGVLHGVVRQVDLNMGDDRTVLARLILRLDDNELLGAELAVRGILITGNDGGAVVARILTYQNRGTGHDFLSFLDYAVPVRNEVFQARPVTYMTAWSGVSGVSRSLWNSSFIQNP